MLRIPRPYCVKHIFIADYSSVGIQQLFAPWAFGDACTNKWFRGVLRCNSIHRVPLLCAKSYRVNGDIVTKYLWGWLAHVKRSQYHLFRCCLYHHTIYVIFRVNFFFRNLAIIFARFGFFEVFRALFLHVLRYQFETWYIHAAGSVTRQVRVSFQSGHFDLLYSQK